MNGTARPEAAFRHWLRCYPRWYRREQEDEMIAVLLAVAREGSQGPVVAQCWDLVRSAVKVPAVAGVLNSVRQIRVCSRMISGSSRASGRCACIAATPSSRWPSG